MGLTEQLAEGTPSRHCVFCRVGVPQKKQSSFLEILTEEASEIKSNGIVFPMSRKARNGVKEAELKCHVWDGERACCCFVFCLFVFVFVAQLNFEKRSY